MTPIAYIRTPFKEKFGIPRQPLLIREAWGHIEFEKTDFNLEAIRGIDAFSHLWLIFSFHQALSDGPKALVRPPRFEGQEKWGVYATRSPHRPNHLGLSAVEYDAVEITPNKMILKVKGVDLVDGTPIFDIKPYIPYSDSIPFASAGPFHHRPQEKEVIWKVLPEGLNAELKILIEKVIAYDPRLGLDQLNSFGVSVGGYNVRFSFKGNFFEIESISKE